jgi:predicted dehydrogenase
MDKLRVGVIGCGYWGPKLVRNFHELEGSEVVSACDTRPDRLESIARSYPKLRLYGDYRELVRDPAVAAVVVATPASTHFEIAREALLEGKHALVEKPLTTSSRDARELVKLALKNRLVLLTGHTFLYHGAIRKIRDLLRRGDLGDLLYLDSNRSNLGQFQDDVNVIWDLASHDISIMDFLFAAPPVSVSATGAAHTDRGLEDMAFITLRFPNNLIGHVTVNWLSPTKVRTILVGGSKKMAIYDDNDATGRLKIYDRGIEFSPPVAGNGHRPVRYREGGIVIPELEPTEALQTEAADFRDSIAGNKVPTADGKSGLRVVRLLELACLSLSRGGAPVELTIDD